MASSLESIGAVGRPVPDRLARTAVSSFPRFGEQAAGSYWPSAVGVFLGVAAVLWWTMAERLSLIGDEGIYLEGARRILQGQAPYRDFFVLTGPGTFWLHALIFKMLGLSLRHGHVVLILDVAFLSAAVFWLAAHLLRPPGAAILTFLFAAFETANPTVLTVNHRWDSAALAVAAVVLLFHALERALDRPRWWLIAGGGVLAALAAWTTPTLLAVVAALGVGLLPLPNRVRSLAAYAGGVAAGSALPAAVLWREGALAAMLQHLLWSGSNYPSANGFSYGTIAGGYSGVLAGAAGLELAIRLVILAVVAIPVYLPLLGFVVWPWRLRRASDLGRLERRRLRFLLVASFGLWLSAYPWFLGHLTSVAALSYVLGAAWLGKTLVGRAKFATVLSLVLLGAIFLSSTVRSTPAPAMETRVGRVRASAGDLAVVEAVSKHVPAGDTLFVFPYQPIIYFLTGATNPCRYSFLQPGMMNDRDEAAALADLERNPPHWIFYEDVPPQTYLRISPHSDPKRLRMPHLEAFIRSRYRLADEYRSPQGTFQIRELRSGAPDSGGRP